MTYAVKIIKPTKASALCLHEEFLWLIMDPVKENVL